MKMITSFPEDTLPVLEEGSIRYDNKTSLIDRIKRHNSCSRVLEIVKIILYLELILFIGWIGCTYLSNPMGGKNYNNPESERTLARGSAPTKFTPSDLINRVSYEPSVTRARERRNSEAEGPTRESCERNVDATRQRTIQLSTHFVVGDASDPNVNALRDSCRNRLPEMAMRVIILKVTSRMGSIRPTDEEWNSLALNLTEANKRDASPEIRQQIEANGPPSQDLVNELSGAIESMINDYKTCEKILSYGIPSTEPSLADILKQHDTCSKALTELRADLVSFMTQIVPGEQTDPKVSELREIIEEMTVGLFNNITNGEQSDWDVPTMLAQYGNITDQQWQDFVHLVQESVFLAADAATKAKLENNHPPMQEMVSKIRNVVLVYLTHIGTCNALQITLNEVEATLGNQQS